MRSVRSLVVSLALVVVATGSSAAEDVVRPSFATLDSTGEASQVVAGAALSIADELPGSLLRGDVSGQFLVSSGLGRVGGYAAAAISSVVFDSEPDFDEGDEPDLGTAYSGVQLGGLFQTGAADSVDLAVRLGVILSNATGSKDGSDLRASLPNLATAQLMRPADLPAAFPDATWARIGVSPTYHQGQLLARVDLGADVPVLDTEGIRPFFHVNVGVGMAQKQLSATVEVQNVFSPTQDEDDFDGRFFHTGTVSARFHAGRVTPFAALSSPLGEGRGDILALTLGVSALL